MWKLLYSVKERDKIESIETPTFTMKQTERVVNQGLMIASVLNDVVEYSRATLEIIDRGMETYTTNYVDPANGGRHGHEEAKDLRKAALNAAKRGAYRGEAQGGGHAEVYF